MNSVTRKIIEVCCITVALLILIDCISHIVQRKWNVHLNHRNHECDCHMKKNSPSDIIEELNVNQINQNNIFYDLEKKEIVKAKIEREHIATQETPEMNDETVYEENESRSTQTFETDSLDAQSTLLFEDGRVLDCSFLKGINKTEMFDRGDPFPIFIKDKTQNRTFYTCNNCSR